MSYEDLDQMGGDQLIACESRIRFFRDGPVPYVRLDLVCVEPTVLHRAVSEATDSKSFAAQLIDADKITRSFALPLPALPDLAQSLLQAYAVSPPQLPGVD